MHTHHTSLGVVAKANKCLGWVAKCCDSKETRAKFSAQVMKNFLHYAHKQ